MPHISFREEQSVVDKLDAEVKKRGRFSNRSDVIREAIQKYFKFKGGE